MANEVGNLVVKVGMDTMGFQEGMTTLNRQLRLARSEVGLASSQLRNFGTSTDGLRLKSNALSRQVEIQRQRVEALSKAHAQSVKEKGADAAATQELEKRLNWAKADLLDYETALEEVNKEIERQSSSWYKVSERFTSAGERMQSVGQQMSDVGDTLTAGLTVPIVGLATASVKSAIDFETAFAGVRKTVDATESEFAELETGIREMAKEIPVAATEIAGVAEAAGQLGIEKENILEFTRTMVDLGVATNMSSDQAATSLARLANITQMPQSEFDRLGSTIVELGNNLATTESEITEMALRLAGAGNQVGMTEAQILSFAGALSSVGIEAEAGGSAFSRVMLNIQKAVQDGSDDLNKFAKVAGMSADEFKKSFEQDAAGAIIAFIEGLGEMQANGENAAAALDELGLSEIRVRDALLRASGAGDLFRQSLEMGNRAWEENTALTKEAEERYNTAESQLKIFWNRLKDVAITMGQAVVPALLDGLDAIEPMIGMVGRLAEGFANLDPTMQKVIIAFAGITAAIGPALSLSGRMLSGLGTLSLTFGNLAGAAASAGGALSALRLGLSALTGPIGIGIGLITTIGTMTAVAAMRQREFRDVNLETVESLTEEANALETNIERFEELQNKNQLTNDEMARFVDLATEMQNTKEDEKLEKLREEYEKLLEKSGLTNDEMSEFVSLNDELAGHLDESNQKITEQGNVLVGNIDALKDLNEEQRERIRLELEAQQAAAEANMAENLRKQRDLQQEINELTAKIPETQAKIAEQEQYIGELAEQYRKAREEGNIVEEAFLLNKIAKENQTLQTYKDQLAEQMNLRLEKEEELDLVNQELDKLGDIHQRMIELELAQVGINAKKGEELQAIDKEIRKLEEQKRQLREKRDRQEINNQEYQEGINKIDGQISKLRTARSRVEEITGEARETNRELGKDIDKKVNVDDKGTAAKVQREAEKPATKQVTLRAVWQGLRSGLSVALRAAIPGFAKGTDYAPGGLALVGEEGPELVNLPRGAQVIPAPETRSILVRAQIPALANGGNIIRSGLALVGEEGPELLNMRPAEVTSLTHPLSTGDNERVIALLQEIANGIRAGQVIVMDGRIVGQITEPYVTENQERKKRVRDSFAT